MKNVPNPENGHQYSAREIIEILDRAKALGWTYIRVEGFEARMRTERAQPAAHEESTTQKNNHSQFCDCGEEKIFGKWGPYCVACFKEKKDREETARRRR